MNPYSTTAQEIAEVSIVAANQCGICKEVITEQQETNWRINGNYYQMKVCRSCSEDESKLERYAGRLVLIVKT